MEILQIYVAPDAGAPMIFRKRVIVRAGLGIEGDRYALQRGSWKQPDGTHSSKRQCTFMSFEDIVLGSGKLAHKYSSGFTPEETRRNFIVQGGSLQQLLAREFQIDEAVFRGIEFTDPCERPAKLVGKRHMFAEGFPKPMAGLLAEVVQDGIVCVGDVIKPLPKR